MFALDETEAKAALNWIKRHKCIHRGNHGAIGGATTYSFTPTGIGVVVKLSCACGKEKDLTDYDSW